MPQINPTRMELIKLRVRAKLAAKGKNLLKKKEEVLILELLKFLKESKLSRNVLKRLLDTAYKRTSIASSYIGDFELEQASNYVDEVKPIAIKIKNIMGVKIPEINFDKSANTSTNLISGSLAVNDVGDSFNDAKNAIIELAKREQSIKKLLIETEKTKRRVNALEYIVIPKIMKTAKNISVNLEEIDRSMFSALKHVKKNIVARSEG